MPDAPAGQKPAEGGGLQDAIAEAVKSIDPTKVTGGDAQGESPEGDDVPRYLDGTPVPPGESTPSTVDSQEESEAPAEREAAQPEDLPDKYWGTDLTGLSDEQKQAVLARFEQEESYIRQLQAELAAKPERQARPEPEAPVEVSDDDLLRAAGYDPEDMSVEQSKGFIVPLLRNQLALEERVEAQEQYVAESQAETYWNQSLDDLEAEFGKLPGNRVNVLKRAVDDGISNPHELYFKLAAPARREVGEFVTDLRQKQQREGGQRDAAGATRPSSSTAVDAGITKDMSLREAVAAAAQAAEKQTKLTWRDAVRTRVTRGAQGPATPGA